MLTKGKPAPVLKSYDLNGDQIGLSNFRGQKVLLTFFRTETCPFCNLRVHNLIQNHPQLKEKGLQIIAVFAASKEGILQYAGKQNPPFPIIPDPEQELYHKFNIGVSTLGLFLASLRISDIIKTIQLGLFNMKSIFKKPILPADFLIDEEGKIFQAYYGKDFGDHIELKEVYEWLRIPIIHR